jgi:hypothetical protein
MTHCEKQFEYLMWKKENILEKVSRCKIYPTDHKAPNGVMFKGYHLNSQTNPVYTGLYDRFYFNGKKSLDEYLVKMLTPLSLALLYMDDGNCSKPDKKHWTKENFTIATCNFDYANQLLLKKSFKILFDLEWNVNKTSYKYYHLRLLRSNNEKFVSIIKPYVEMIPSMMYKLGPYVNTSEKMEIQSDLNGDIQSYTEMNIADFLS